jgi:N-acetylneuraminic acid mutarotase
VTHVLPVFRPAASKLAIIATLALHLGGGLASNLAAQESFPAPRLGAVAVELDGIICTFGGFGADDNPLSTVECYDSAADQWRHATAMPTKRGLLGAALAGGEIYLVGGTQVGRDKLGIVERYNSELDTWSRGADLPTARNALSATTVSDRIYAIGGWGVDADDRARDFDTVEVYDHRENRWSLGAPMPSGRSHMAVAVIDSKIYAIGGWMRRSGLHTALGGVTIYDSETDSWSRTADMPTPRYLATAAVVGGRIYVLGGWTLDPHGEPGATDLVEVFDPAAGLWARDLSLPTPRAAHASAVVDGQILLFGGASTPPSQANEDWMLTTIDRYTPSDFESLVPIGGPGTGAESVAEVASAAEFRDGGAYGRILDIEEPFGNLHTNFVQGDLQRLGLSPGEQMTTRFGTHDFPATFGKDFSDVGRGEWVIFVVEDGTVTVARNFASAAEACGCVAGEEIFVTTRE